MNLYHVSQSIVTGWDTYSDFVCVAESPSQARSMIPHRKNSHTFMIPLTDILYGEEASSGEWPLTPEFVTVELLGHTHKEVCQIICSSYHAG